MIMCYLFGSLKVLENFVVKLVRILVYKWCDYKKFCNVFFKK